MKLSKIPNLLISVLKKQIIDYIEKNSLNLQQYFLLSRHKRSNEQNLEEATEKGKYNYWLSQEDIADIARLEYANFHKPNKVEVSDFEIVGSLDQLITQIASFLVNAKKVSNARHTMVINVGAMHWVTLVFSYQDKVTTAYYVNSLGSSLQPEYDPLFQAFEVELIDLSQYCSQQQTDAYNCGLWVLENSADINQMLDDRLSGDWLIQQLQRPRNTAYFAERRESLSELLRTDIERYRRRSEQEESIRVKNPTQSISVRRPLESSPIQEPLTKKIKPLNKEEQVAMFLELFVHKFMLNFIKRLSLYHITAKDHRITEEALKAELKTGATGALVGISTAQSIVGSIPSIVASVRTLSSQFYLSKSKAQKITRIFSTLTRSLNQLLSEAGVQIFKSYESQFMQVTDKAGDKMAIEKLAEDAGARALNYIAENGAPNQLISIDLITQGVVLGKSDKFFDPSFKNVRLRISGNRIQDRYGKTINTANLFEKTGLLLSNIPEQSYKFYRLRNTLDGSSYGYRHPFNWEIKNGELMFEYQNKYLEETTVVPNTENQFQYFSRRYNYLDYPEMFSIKQTAQDILHKINVSPTEVKHIEPVNSPKKRSIIFNLRNPVENFSGRKEILIQLHHLLSGNNIGVVSHLLTHLSLDTAAKPIQTSHSLTSLSGLGGIGKTQLALRYAQQYAESYDHNLIWINAETKNDILQCLYKLAVQLEINIKDKYGNQKDVSELMHEIYTYFSDEKSLFIFDNVENYKEFSDLIPKVLKGNTPTILITSRYSNWKNIASVLSIDIFTEQEAKEFIKKELSIETDQQEAPIKELITLLQGLPLAFQQAVAYIDVQRNLHSDYSISDYINQYKLKSQEMLNFDFFNYSNDPYAKTVFVTWKITLDKIKQNLLIGEKALEILNIMAYLHPDSITNALFLPLENPEKLASAIHLLRSYSMINQQNQPDISTIHRLVQQVVRINLERDVKAFQRVAEQTIKITERFYHNKETELHYIHFLLHMSQYDQLALQLNLGFTRRRVLDILIYSHYDINLATIYDNARLIMNKEAYFEFMGESLHYILKRGLLFYLSETLNYLEKNLVEEVITRQDLSSIIEYRYKIAVKYKGRWLMPGSIERARQLGALRLFFEFEHKLLSQDTISCSGERKKRALALCTTRDFFSTSKQITSQELIQHLQRVGRLAEFAATSMLSKDILSDLLQGKLSRVAMNFGLITGSTLLGEVSNVLLTQGEILTSTEKQLLEKNLALDGKFAFNILFHVDVIPLGKRLFLGNAIKVAAPFIGRGTSIFSNTYYLFDEIRMYHQGNSKVLPDLMANSMLLGLDGLQSGVKAAEYLELIEGFSETTGPLGEIASLTIWIESDLARAKKQEQWIEKYVHLDTEEKWWEGLRAFAHFAPSAYLETKAYNNQLVKLAIAFLKNNTDIQTYIFPAASSVTQIYANNAVSLRNQISIKLSETNPDPPDEGELFCFPGVEESEAYIEAAEWSYLAYPALQFINFVKVYHCKNAIGVKYVKNRTGNIQLIALSDGNDQVLAATDKPSFIHVSNGNKNYEGGDEGSFYILEGEAITGMIQGGKGLNIAKFQEIYLNGQYYIPLIDYNGLSCRKTKNFRYKLCEKGLKIQHIQKILGIKNQKDIFFITDKNIKYVDGLAGINPMLRDEIFITNKTANNLEIELRPNTVIHCFETFNESVTILHTLQANQSGEVWMHFDFYGPIDHRIYADFSLDALHDIVTYPYAFTFHFLQEQQSFNITLCFPLQSIFNQSQSEILNHVYYSLANNLQIKFNPPYLYIQENSHRSLAQNIHYYSTIAQRLKKTLKIYLAQNEMLHIGYGRQEFLSNDVLKPSHLIAQGDQAFFRIVSGSQLNFPLPEVVIYDSDQGGDFTKTLDLTDIWQQVKQACPEDNTVLRIFQIKQDLIISAEINYYPIGTTCVRLENTWPVAKIKLSAACVNNWYQQLEVILHKTSLAIIANEKGDWHFEHYPLIFNQDKDIIVLIEENLVHERDVIVLKPIGSKHYRFFCHNKTDLIFMNDWDSITRLIDPTLIIYSRFYQDVQMRSKALSSKLSFLDQQIILETQKKQIDQAYKHCVNFSNISLSQLQEYKYASSKENNGGIQSSDSSVRVKRQIDTQKLAKFISTPLFPHMDLSASNNSIHPVNRLDKIKKATTKKSNVSVKVGKKPNISYLHRYTKRRFYQLKKPTNLRYISTHPMTLFNLPEQSIGFNPGKAIDYSWPLHQQDIQHPVNFNDSLTNLPNLLLFGVLLHKKSFLSHSVKNQRPFTNNSLDEIDEIERRIMKALQNPPFF